MGTDVTALDDQVERLREAARQMVRELGVVQPRAALEGISLSQCHVLLELARSGVLRQRELAERLQLDRSTLSRTVAPLLEEDLVERVRSPRDGRSKPLRLTAKGNRRVARIDRTANERVGAALCTLDDEQRGIVVQGLSLYAAALQRSRRRASLTIRPIQPADDADMSHVIRIVMTEFQACGEGYSIQDAEVAHMSRTYRQPRHSFFVIEDAGRVVGGAGIGPLRGGSEEVGELRKMYLLPEIRGLGLGKDLLRLCLEAAVDAGFRTCYLETLGRMEVAGRLYLQAGFRPLDGPWGATGHHACEQYYAKELVPAPETSDADG